MKNVDCLSSHAIMSVSGRLEQLILFWFESAERRGLCWCWLWVQVQSFF